MNFFDENIDDVLFIELLASAITLVGMLLLRSLLRKLAVKRIKKYNMDQSRKYLVYKIINLCGFIVLLTLLAVIWDVTFSGLAVYFTSFFAVAGIGLFAQWSILSNITAAFILFFNYPFKLGSTIKIKDGDNSIEGVITDISMFVIHIKTSSNENYTYPNSLVLQKPIQIIKV